MGHGSGLLRDPLAGSIPPNNLKEPMHLDPRFESIVIEDKVTFADADSHTIREASWKGIADNSPPRVHTLIHGRKLTIAGP